MRSTEVSGRGRENGNLDSVPRLSQKTVNKNIGATVSHEGAVSASGVASQTVSGVLSGSGVLNARPGSTTSSGLLSLMVSTFNADVARHYLEKVADLLLEFAQADTTVKSHMCTSSLLSRLFQMFNWVEPPILLKLLKCINHLSTDPNSLESLQRAEAIKHLIPNLEFQEGPLISKIHHEIFHTQLFLETALLICRQQYKSPWKNTKLKHENQVNTMQVFCKLEDWKLRGQKFFSEGDYESAAFCFKRSGDVYNLKWAKAASCQKEGENKLYTNYQEAVKCLFEAASKYEEIGKVESSAICFMRFWKYAEASYIYLNKFSEPRFEDAGDCFVIAKRWHDAAVHFARGKCLPKCLNACREGGLFEFGWNIVKNWQGDFSKVLKLDFLKRWISETEELLIV